MILPDEFDEKIELWVGETDSEDEGPATPTRTTSSRRVRRTSSRRHTRGTRGISLGPAGEGLIFLKKKLELAAAAQDEEPITRKREVCFCSFITAFFHVLISFTNRIEDVNGLLLVLRYVQEPERQMGTCL